MDDRKLKVLAAVVDEYIRTGEPVGSKAISKLEHIKVSAATIRNDMAVLEEQGYLLKTHTSSGRVPSEKGYRLYVEEVMKRKHDEETYPIIDEIFNRPNKNTRNGYSHFAICAKKNGKTYARVLHGDTAEDYLGAHDERLMAGFGFGSSIIQILP